MFIEVVPAYGRDYRSKKAAVADWQDGKDFALTDLSQGGKYINLADADKHLPSGTTVMVRYKQLTQVAELYRVK